MCGDFSKDELKARLDIGKTILNHLILVIMGVGAGSFSLVVKNNLSVITFLGLVSTFLAVYLYNKTINKISFYLNEIKKCEE